MSFREDRIHGAMPANDLGHIILSAVTVLLILSQTPILVLDDGCPRLAHGSSVAFFIA